MFNGHITYNEWEYHKLESWLNRRHWSPLVIGISPPANSKQSWFQHTDTDKHTYIIHICIYIYIHICNHICLITYISIGACVFVKMTNTKESPARSTVRSQGGGPFRCWVLCLMRLVDIDLSRLFIEYSYICNSYHDVMKYNGISPYCGFHYIDISWCDDKR